MSVKCDVLFKRLQLNDRGVVEGHIDEVGALSTTVKFVYNDEGLDQAIEDTMIEILSKIEDLEASASNLVFEKVVSVTIHDDKYDPTRAGSSIGLVARDRQDYEWSWCMSDALYLVLTAKINALAKLLSLWLSRVVFWLSRSTRGQGANGITTKIKESEQMAQRETASGTLMDIKDQWKSQKSRTSHTMEEVSIGLIILDFLDFGISSSYQKKIPNFTPWRRSFPRVIQKIQNFTHHGGGLNRPDSFDTFCFFDLYYRKSKKSKIIQNFTHHHGGGLNRPDSFGEKRTQHITKTL